jgi:hypothetical protein
MDLLFVLPFAITSCNDDDDDDDDVQGELVGTWKMTESDGSFELIQFKKNGTYVDVYYDAEEKDYDVTEAKWSRSGNVLTITIEDEDGVQTGSILIVSITSSQLTLAAGTENFVWTKVSDSEINKYLK